MAVALDTVVPIREIREIGRRVESFEDRSEARKQKKSSPFLTKQEAGELREALGGWGGPAMLLGCKSVHGAMEAQLMRGQPRDAAKRAVLEELERLHGRAPEGQVVYIVAHEWDIATQSRRGFTAHEVRRAIRYLVLHGRVEKIRVDEPEFMRDQGGKNGLTDRQRDVLKRWTGFDLKIVRRERGEPRMRLSLASCGPRTKEDIWRAQDDALEREWRMMHLSGRGGGKRDYEPAPVDGAAYPAAMAALEVVSAESAIVLRTVYGGSNRAHSQFGELLSGIVWMTRTVQQERQRRAEARAKQLDSPNRSKAEWLAIALREVSPAVVLDVHSHDMMFVGKVRDEAEALLVRASEEYRKARAR